MSAAYDPFQVEAPQAALPLIPWKFDYENE
jgi:hypothetical protein